MQHNFSLKSFNTFGIDASAKLFASFSNVAELQPLLKQYRQEALLVLGGGSNILFTKNFDGLVLHNRITGIECIHQDDQHVLVRAGAGETWHQFVLYCIAHNWAGLENLSLIPGSVGASPMQNIGAYGVEIKDVFESLAAYHIESGEIHTFTNQQCQFGYRESVFKRALKNQYIILDVTFRLSKQANLRTSYGAIQQELAAKNITNPSIKDVSEAVIAIRQSKLPNPAELGNAGSFFKNPVVAKSLYDELQLEYSDIPNYPVSDTHVKLAAGWLIEKAGLKGFSSANCGVHDKQALVLVNHGNCTGQQILDLSTLIIDKIHAQFGVSLEREVNIIS